MPLSVVADRLSGPFCNAKVTCAVSIGPAGSCAARLNFCRGLRCGPDDAEGAGAKGRQQQSADRDGVRATTFCFRRLSNAGVIMIGSSCVHSPRSTGRRDLSVEAKRAGTANGKGWWRPATGAFGQLPPTGRACNSSAGTDRNGQERKEMRQKWQPTGKVGSCVVRYLADLVKIRPWSKSSLLNRNARDSCPFSVCTADETVMTQRKDATNCVSFLGVR
ncbi:hypothetical protein B0H66DRAFT_351181 [Apodospora peruviana]|uniref:Uncharacterized protein n=1 Tax=Apodospora peruviana TaxID=516989 RepID=A0AAE0HV11_9PEZI|nr:hypothetical protein B0H66DRAFT_351181 [Apodospora peruviana]